LEQTKTVFSDVVGALSRAVTDGAFPGCVAAVGTRDVQLWKQEFGRLGQDLGPVTPRTLYDIASLTKILATTATCMALHRDQRLDLSLRIGDLLPEFSDTPIGKSGSTIEHVLAHCSGLSAGVPLFRKYDDYRPLVEAVARHPLEYPPLSRSIYSDFGMILLGECLARLGERPLATLAWTQVFEPLAMRDTFYRPAEIERSRIAPTEFDRDFRGRLIHGEVHDEHAYAMGGVAGHAGLFTTVEDVARFAAEMLRARAGKSDFLPRRVIELFSKRRGLVSGSTRGLGWDTPSDKGSSAGDLFSRRSFGHTGFTGTSLWIDPERGIYAVLLSNRVHPSRKNLKIRAVRREFHDAVIRAVG
jgi:CubicO group peptidase (beta-lactamase class C family)